MSAKLIFPTNRSEIDLIEADMKGYLNVSVPKSPERSYPLYFYNPFRLGQDLDSELEFGKSCIGLPGTVIVKQIDLPTLEAALAQLDEEQFFDYLKPISQEQFNSARIGEWPPSLS
jgi:hypothetical protein